MKPFRFGVNVWRATSRAEWVEKARKIEELGYGTLTVPDHLTDLLAPMPAVLSAAEVTKNLRVGTNVLNNDLRHPILVAREAATVDLLTDGCNWVWALAASERNMTKRGWASIPEVPGSNGWQRRSRSSRVCSKGNGSTSRAATIK